MAIRSLRRVLQGLEACDVATLIPLTIPFLPLPSYEAHALIGTLGRNGTTVDELRTLIQVNRDQVLWLRKVTTGDPLRARVVERMIEFRQEVLRCFEAELANPKLADAGKDVGEETGASRSPSDDPATDSRQTIPGSHAWADQPALV